MWALAQTHYEDAACGGQGGDPRQWRSGQLVAPKIRREPGGLQLVPVVYLPTGPDEVAGAFIRGAVAGHPSSPGVGVGPDNDLRGQRPAEIVGVVLDDSDDAAPAVTQRSEL